MNGRSLAVVIAMAAGCGSSEPTAPVRSHAPRPIDASPVDASRLETLGGTSSFSGTAGVGTSRIQKGISNAEACALVAAVPEVAALGGSRVVTEISDFTDTLYGCTGSAGECLHWCRIDRDHRPWHHFAVDPHTKGIFVCRLADVQTCVTSPLDPLASWQAHGAP